MTSIRSPYFLLASLFSFGVLFLINGYIRPKEHDRKELNLAQNLVSTGEGDSGKLNRAKAITGHLLARDPRNINALFLQGWAEQRSGQPNEALNHYKTLLNELRELGKFASFNSAVLYEARGDTDQALKFFLDSVQLDPKFEASWLRVIALLRKLNRTDEAESTLEEALFHLPQSGALLAQRGSHAP